VNPYAETENLRCWRTLRKSFKCRTAYLGIPFF